jgi:hypothetical protein
MEATDNATNEVSNQPSESLTQSLTYFWNQLNLPFEQAEDLLFLPSELSSKKSKKRVSNRMVTEWFREEDKHFGAFVDAFRIPNRKVLLSVSLQQTPISEEAQLLVCTNNKLSYELYLTYVNSMESPPSSSLLADVADFFYK